MSETLDSGAHLLSVRPGSLISDSNRLVDMNNRTSVFMAPAAGIGEGDFRTEIETSAPFNSVKDAVSRYGGLAFRKSTNYHLDIHFHYDDALFQSEEGEENDAASVEEEAALLEKELIMKEKDTFEVLKELQATKIMVEDLRSKVQIAESTILPTMDTNLVGKKLNIMKEDKENDPSPKLANENPVEVLDACPSSAPGLILIELKQAKLNLAKTTTDLAEIRGSVESYKRKIEKERMSLEKTRGWLSSNSSKISSLEEELTKTRMKLHLVKNVLNDGKDVSTEIHRLSCEHEMFKKLRETAKAEVMRVMSEIEQTKAKIKTTENKMIAARTIKDLASTVEAIALVEIKVLETSGDSLSAFLEKKSNRITLTYEEYSLITSKAQEAEENSKRGVMDALLQVDKANMSKMEILKKVDEAVEETKTSKKALEDALKKVEQADKAKVAVEETLHKMRSEHGKKRRSVHKSAKFKIYGPSDIRRDSEMLDLNGMNLVSEVPAVPAPVLNPTLSIRHVLSRNMPVAKEFEPGKIFSRQKVSLGQMLAKHSGELSTSWGLDKEDGSRGGSIYTTISSGRKLPTKRKKFGFALFSVLLAKRSGKKKKKKESSMKTDVR